MSPRTFTFSVTTPPPVGLQWTPPAPGFVKAFSTNTIFDVKPTNWTTPGAGGVWQVLNSWNGGAFASTLGSHGSILYHGGGHNDYDGNEVYRLDIASGTFSRLCFPTPVTVPLVYLDGLNGEILQAYGGGTGVIAPLHTYNSPFFVPPSVAGNASGYFCVGPTNSGNGKGLVHRFNLDGNGPAVSANTLWSRRSDNRAATSGSGYYPSGAWDSLRNKYWYVNIGAWTLQSYDWADGTWTTHTNATSGTLASATPFAHCPTRDCLVLAQYYGGQNYVRVFDTSGTWATVVGRAWTNVATTGTPPTTTQNCQLTWCADLGCFLLYEGVMVTSAGSLRIYKLTPPAGAITGTWTWSYEDFQKENPADVTALGSSDKGPLTKFQYVPSIKCAVYSDIGYNAQSQIIFPRSIAFRMTGA